MANILGIDYGGRRIGLAIGDDEAKLARPLQTIINSDDLAQVLRQVISQNQVKTLVVGLPRSLDGEETGQTREVREFAATALRGLDLPIQFQDEAATTEMAKHRVYGKKSQIEKGRLDMEAAAIILQDYLDSLP